MTPHVAAAYQQHIVSEAPVCNHEVAFYLHKKFNSTAYTHKKFGTKFTRSRSVESLAKTIADTTTTTTTTIKLPTVPKLPEVLELHENIIAEHQQHKRFSNGIFRPYALGDNTPRKRRQPNNNPPQREQQLQQMHKLYQSEGDNLHLMHGNDNYTPAAWQHHTATTTVNPQHNFTLMLQKQREAFHLRHILQLSGKLAAPCTMWPSSSSTLAPAISRHTKC